jgi:non-ribosomal peptide synthetase component F
MKELEGAYREEGRGSREPPAQYVDYARRMAREDQGEHLNYWRKVLDDAPPYTSLVSDFPRPPIPSSLSNTLWGHLDPSASLGLRSLARALGSTVFEVTFVCFAVALCRFADQEEAVLGYTSNQHPMDDSIGIYLSILPFFMKMTGVSKFSELLKNCHAELGKNYDHTCFSFSKLARITGQEGGSGYFPIFQVSYSYQALNRNAEYKLSENVTARRFLIPPQHTTWDLTLFVEEDENGTVVPRIEYQVDLFEEGTIQSFLDAYLFLLNSVIENPEIDPRTAPLIPKSRAEEYLYKWNETSGVYSRDRTLHSFIEEHAQKNSETLAVIEDDADDAAPRAQKMTYAELNSEANRMARYFREKKQLQPGFKIGLMFEKSARYYATMIGTEFRSFGNILSFFGISNFRIYFQFSFVPLLHIREIFIIKFKLNFF